MVMTLAGVINCSLLSRHIRFLVQGLGSHNLTQYESTTLNGLSISTQLFNLLQIRKSVRHHYPLLQSLYFLFRISNTNFKVLNLNELLHVFNINRQYAHKLFRIQLQKPLFIISEQKANPLLISSYAEKEPPTLTLPGKHSTFFNTIFSQLICSFATYTSM